MPFYNSGKQRANTILSEISEIERLTNSDIEDRNLVLLTNYFVHFQSFPLEVYQDRVTRFARAIEKLLNKKPRARVFFKGLHYIRSHDEAHIYDSVITQIYQEIVFKAFKSLQERVVYLDTWSMAGQFDNDDVHVSGQCLEAHIQQFMAYLC